MFLKEYFKKTFSLFKWVSIAICVVAFVVSEARIEPFYFDSKLYFENQGGYFLYGYHIYWLGLFSLVVYPVLCLCFIFMAKVSQFIDKPISKNTDYIFGVLLSFAFIFGVFFILTGGEWGPSTSSGFGALSQSIIGTYVLNFSIWAGLVIYIQCLFWVFLSKFKK